MSNRPDNPSPPPGDRSGWRTPESKDKWFKPETSQVSAQSGGWRVPGSQKTPEREGTPVEEFETKPESTGGWHLPGGNVLPIDDTSPAQTAAGDAPVAEAVAEAVLPPDGEPVVAEVAEKVEEDTSPVEVLPFEGAVPGTMEDPDATAIVERDELEPLDEDDDDETFSMSELVALASLVDTPQKQAEPAPSDPAEYARRELQRLAQQAEPARDEEAPGSDDPAEYARRQLELLRDEGLDEETAEDDDVVPVSTSQPAVAATPAPAAPAVPGLTPAQEALAKQYHDAEARTRDLRRQYENGQISREDLQNELKKAMVLDENRVWWMLGVESEGWYRYENGQWVMGEPPVLAAERAVREARETGARPVTNGGTATAPAEGTGAYSLPYLPDTPRQPTGSQPAEVDLDRTIPTTPVTGESYTGPLPRNVPVIDSEATIPGTRGIFLDEAAPTIRNPDLTVPSSGMGEPTVRSAAQLSDVPGIASPIESAVPDTSTLMKEAVERQQRNLIRTILIAAAVILGVLLLVGALVAVLLVTTYNGIAEPWRDEITALANYDPQFQTVSILAADGSVIAQINSETGGARTEIRLDQMSPAFVHAVISIENERFYQDPGWDPVAIGRALLQNLATGDIESGGSTITQQVARRLVLQNTDVTPERKLQEVVVAAEIAQRYDKNFILQLYLNEVFFGNQSYGIEAASEFYFDKPASELNLPESALLAGLIQAPATYDPVVNRNAAFARMNDVLAQQAAVGCLQLQYGPSGTQAFCVTPDTLQSGEFAVQRANVEARVYRPRQFRQRYPHFVNYIQTIVERSFGTDEMFRRGFRIQTTLVPSIQDTAQQALEQQLGALANNGVNNGAVLVVSPTDGAIRAMVGSVDFYDEDIDGQFNNVFAWHQPGSAIKPIIYTAGMEGVDRNGVRQYITPASILWDVPTRYADGYTPVNFDGQFRGPVSVRNALAQSLNVPTVKLFDFIGIDRFVDTGRRMGLEFLPEAQFSLATALGATDVRLYDMVEAYGVLANDGIRVPYYSIQSITDAAGNQVALPERAQPAQAVAPGIAYLMQNILSDNDARAPQFGQNSGLTLGEYPGLVAAKTGTSNDNRDLWTVGFTSNMVVGVWLGRNDNAPTLNTSGLAAVPVWNAVLRSAISGSQVPAFNNPGGVSQQQVCTLTGTLYDPAVPQGCGGVRAEFFLAAQPPPPATQGLIQNVQIDTWTGLRANQYCPESVETRQFVAINDQSAVQWLSSAAGASVAAQLGIRPPIQAIPAAECSSTNTRPIIQITSPQNGQQGLQGIVPILGTVSGAELASYQIEVASAASPNNFVIVDGPRSNPISNGQIGQWDTTRNFGNGQFRIRLAANSTAGGVIYRYADVTVANPTPTPTPTLTPSVTPLPPATWTPIPFETLPAVIPPVGVVTQLPGVLPTFDPNASGFPTPTATLDFGSS
jgi:penicillin-binding protein 1C